MLSQNVAKTTVPSYYMIRTNLPHRKPQNQWEGVFYFSGVSKRQKHLMLLHHKRGKQAEVQSFNASKQSVLNQLLEKQQQWSSAAGAAATATSNAAVANKYGLAVLLNEHGLYEEAAPLVDELHRSAQLSAGQYANLVESLSAKRLGHKILVCEAQSDPTLTYKFMGDESGAERASAAHRIFDMAFSSLPREAVTSSVASTLVNTLMKTLLSCGFTHVSSVANSIYDRMGTWCIHPTITTYEHVMTSLALQGNMAEAEDILAFLRSHHNDHVAIGCYNALLMGHRESRQFDRCDALWQQLVDLRWPRANVLSAELYLRSIIDNSYTPMSAPLSKMGSINVVEKKKVPLVLAQMEDLGIPRSHLSAPLTDEVEDALRKYAMHRSRFYEWGRAVKQFDFIEFRRRNGWLYDIQLMTPTSKTTPPVRDASMREGSLAPVATAELPAFFSERQPWETTPLADVLFTNTSRERNEDVRAGDIYYNDERSIHERSVTWMNEVPETRYDQLYGVNNPDIPKIGIRRHLEVEYVNRKETLERDRAVVKKVVSGGRRVRQKVEASHTHRNAASQ